MPHKNPADKSAAQRKRREKKRTEATAPGAPPADPGSVPPLPLVSAADALAVLAEQVNAVRAGGSQATGRTLAYLIAVALRAIEVADLAARFAALEAAVKEIRGREADVKRTRGALTTGLARLEQLVERLPAAAPPDRDEAGWLATYERLGAAGHFDREPDFPTALALFRDTLARARASTDPPFDPPAEFMRNHTSEALRVNCWRRERFPEMAAAQEWLGEMLSRVVHDVPPVSEAEFADLATWFAASFDRLPSPLDVVDGCEEYASAVRFALAKGPRAEGAGLVAERVRQLRKRYG